MSDPTPESTPDPMAGLVAALQQAAASEGLSAAVPPPEEPEHYGLPVHARGLLKIRVPVRVTLAAQRKSIQEIIELGPGSIVKFDKTCDEALELTVGDRPIAMGDVVKVGDKFGLRIAGLITNDARAL
jgi:flagellar motor switch protein FliN/FliY